jgi:MerR family transcriptional regulator, light-induced transcriptional regulator
MSVNVRVVRARSIVDDEESAAGAALDKARRSDKSKFFVAFSRRLMATARDPHQAAHPIQVAARRAGLSTYVLRAWEQRYHAVSPRRSPSGRRLYSDAEIERLQLLQFATRAGRRIGDVVNLPHEELLALCTTDTRATVDHDRSQAGQYYRLCMDAIHQLNSAALESALYNACVLMGLSALLEEVLAPLLRAIGEECRQGAMRIGEEHMATAVIRSFLGTLKLHRNVQPDDPRIVVATPAGQIHELGAMMVAVTASAQGWNAIYLGTDTPADEIAAAAAQTDAHAVAISIVYPADDRRLQQELRHLRRQLGPQMALLVGGAAARHYASVLREIGAILLERLSALHDILGRLALMARMRAQPASFMDRN